MKVYALEVPSTLGCYGNQRPEPEGVVVLFRCSEWGTWEIDQQLLIGESNIAALVGEIKARHPKAAEFRILRCGLAAS